MSRWRFDLPGTSCCWLCSPQKSSTISLDGGDGALLTNHGNDVHAVGTLAPIVGGYVGCIVIRPDRSRFLARAVPDPLAHRKPD